MVNNENNNKIDDSTVKMNSKIIWFGLLANSPIFITVILFMDKMLQQDAIMPESKNIFIGICVLSIPLSLILLNKFKRLQNTIRDNLQLGIENTRVDLQKYMTLMVIGMSLANLPTIMGLVFYIMIGDLYLALFFIALSFPLGFLYKPELS